MQRWNRLAGRLAPIVSAPEPGRWITSGRFLVSELGAYQPKDYSIQNYASTVQVSDELRFTVRRCPIGCTFGSLILAMYDRGVAMHLHPTAA